jgi:hypothetical protein
MLHGMQLSVLFVNHIEKPRDYTILYAKKCGASKAGKMAQEFEGAKIAGTSIAEMRKQSVVACSRGCMSRRLCSALCW